MNVISSQWHYHHQCHFISMTSSTTLSHLNIIINNNITSYHIIINDNIILISILPSITTSPHINFIIDNNIISNHIPHIHIYKISCLRFTLLRSLDNISQKHSSINDVLHPISRKYYFSWKSTCTGINIHSHDWVPWPQLCYQSHKL